MPPQDQFDPTKPTAAQAQPVSPAQPTVPPASPTNVPNNQYPRGVIKPEILAALQAKAQKNAQYGSIVCGVLCFVILGVSMHIHVAALGAAAFGIMGFGVALQGKSYLGMALNLLGAIANFGFFVYAFFS